MTALALSLLIIIIIIIMGLLMIPLIRSIRQLLNQVSDQLSNIYVVLAWNDDLAGLHRLGRLPNFSHTKELRAWLRLQRLLALAGGKSLDDADEALQDAYKKWGHGIAASTDSRIREECNLGSPSCPACSEMIQWANESLEREKNKGPLFLAVGEEFINYRCPIAARVDELRLWTDEHYEIVERIRVLLTAATSRQLTKEEIDFLKHEGIQSRFIPKASTTCD